MHVERAQRLRLQLRLRPDGAYLDCLKVFATECFCMFTEMRLADSMVLEGGEGAVVGLEEVEAGVAVICLGRAPVPATRSAVCPRTPPPCSDRTMASTRL